MSRNLAYFLIISLIWGFTWAAAKVGLQSVPPLLFAALRFLLTAALLLIFVRGGGAAFSGGRWQRTVASALLVNTATYGVMFWALQHVPTGLAGMVNMALIPVMLFTIAAIAGEERPTWRHAVALVIGCAGLVGLFWTRVMDGGVPGVEASGIGLAAVIVATGCYSVGSFVARPLVGPVTPLALTLVQAMIGGVTLLVLSLATESVVAVRPTPLAIASVIYLSLFGTIIAYTLYLMLLRTWGTARAGLYAFLSPIVALSSGVWLFGESVGVPESIGGVLLLAAAAIALAPNRSRTAAPSAGSNQAASIRG